MKHAGGLGSTHAPMGRENRGKKGHFLWLIFQNHVKKAISGLFCNLLSACLLDALQDAIEAGSFLLPLCTDNRHTSASRVKPPS